MQILVVGAKKTDGVLRAARFSDVGPLLCGLRGERSERRHDYTTF
jgi:hypothetical protein